MILYYNIENYKAFRDKVEFNMIACSNNQKHQNDEHVYNGFGIPLLRTSAIYGNNGAGKSTLLESIMKLRMIVTGMTVLKGPEDLKTFKLDSSYENKPTVFEIEFIAEGERYCYHLSILKSVIVEEWLCVVKPDNSNDYIFIRELKEKKTILKLPLYEHDMKEKMRIEVYAEELDRHPSMTFLKYGIRQYDVLKVPFGWFAHTLEVVRPNAHYIGYISFFKDEKLRSLAINMLSFLKLGIEDVKVKTLLLDDLFIGKDREIVQELKNDVDDNGYVFIKRGETDYTVFKDDDDCYWAGRIVTIHKNGVEFELEEESMGTRMIFELIPGFVGSIVNGKVYLFDELECNKHPEVTKELIILYLLAGANHQGQLIFTTHECNLLDLDILRTDEIWFSEKDGDGVSHVYSLSEFKPNYDKDIRKGYIEGRFTTIPFFADPKELNWYGDSENN